MHPLSCGFSPTHDPPQAGTKREARHLGGSIAPVKEHDPIGNKRKHGAARMEDTEGPKRLGSGAWGRRQGLAGLRDDAPSEARGADGERAGRRPRAPTRKQAREHKLHGRRAVSSRRGGRRAVSSRRGGRRAVSSRRGGRQAGSSRRGLRDDTPSEAHGADAERAAHGADGEQAGQANGPRRGRRAGGPPPPGTNTQNTRIQRGRDPPRQTAQRTPAS